MRDVLAAIALVLLCAGPLVLFAALDGRPPDDHDAYYTGHLRSEVFHLADRPGDVLRRRLVNDGGHHPPMADLALLGSLKLLGPSLFAFRVATLPFLLLLVLGTAGAVAELLGRRAGLLAGLVVGCLPIVVQASRKTDLMFHAAGVTAIALWLAMRLVARADAGWATWLVFGAVQGLRCYSHPIVLADLALLQVGLGVLLWSRRGAAGRWLGASAVAALVALPFLDPGGGGASWALPKYWAFRGGFVVGAAEGTATSLPAAAASFARDLGWFGLRPGLVLLLVVPALAAVAPALRDRSTPEARRGLILISLVLAGQIPLVLVTRSHGAFVVDWLVLAPAAIAGAVIAVERASDRFAFPSRLRRGWAAALAITAIAGSWGPTLVSGFGPDPVVAPSAYASFPWRALIDPGAGGARLQHHLVSRGPGPGGAVAAAAGPGTGRPASVGVAWMEAGPDCEWRWRSAPEATFGSDWPFVLAGFSGLAPTDPRHAPRASVIGLHSGPRRDEGQWQVDGSTLDPACAAAAAAVAAVHLGVASDRVSVHADPARWFLGTLNQPPSSYQGWLLIVQR